MNQFMTVPKVFDMFPILTDLTKVLLSFVCWSFQVLGETTMDKGIRSGKSLNLGMPKAPQGNIQGRLKRLSLGMPQKASPLSSQSISMSLGAIFLFITWYEFCLERRVLYLVFLSGIHNHSSLNTPLREIHLHDNLLEYSMCFT